MEYIKGRIDKTGIVKNDTVVTLGKFDGFHKGHMLLIDEVKKQNFTTVLFTFEVSKSSKQIYTSEEKLNLIKKFGIDILVEYPFDNITRNMKPEEFINKVLFKTLGAKVIVVGDDFKFGHNRSGNVNILENLSKKYNYKLIVIKKLEDVSSTIIRNEILNSNMEKVNDMLGRPYSVEGIVLNGNAIGRTIGIPTINISPERSKILPKKGVYASKIYIDSNVYKGITNIGYKPTITGKRQLGVETNIFDFNQDVYGKYVKVELIKFVREEKKFRGIEELTKQMNMDIESVKKIKE